MALTTHVNTRYIIFAWREAASYDYVPLYFTSGKSCSWRSWIAGTVDGRVRQDGKLTLKIEKDSRYRTLHYALLFSAVKEVSPIQDRVSGYEVYILWVSQNTN